MHIFYTKVDFAGNETRNLVLESRSTDPTDPKEGQVWFDEGEGIPVVWAGGKKVHLSGGVGEDVVEELRADIDASPRPYEHVQASPSTTWSIPHNLGVRPSVTTLSTGGAEMRGRVDHLSENTLTITFNLPVAGLAHLV